jgi:ribosomal protein S18 acetylase RimI-like enzyme
MPCKIESELARAGDRIDMEDGFYAMSSSITGIPGDSKDYKVFFDVYNDGITPRCVNIDVLKEGSLAHFRLLRDEGGAYAGFMQVTLLVIHPDYHRQGIGTRCLASIERLTRDRTDCIGMMASAVNTRSLALFLSHGFSVERYYYVHGEVSGGILFYRFDGR